MPEIIVPAALIMLVVIAAWLWSLIPSTHLSSQDGRILANVRAEAMLREVLTEQEQQDLARHGYLEIASPSHPSRTYRIPRRRGQITLYERGVPIVTLCVQPTVPMPDADLVLLHKVLIEADEAMYLAVANRFHVRHSGFARW